MWLFSLFYLSYMTVIFNSSVNRCPKRCHYFPKSQPRLNYASSSSSPPSWCRRWRECSWEAWEELQSWESKSESGLGFDLCYAEQRRFDSSCQQLELLQPSSHGHLSFVELNYGRSSFIDLVERMKFRAHGYCHSSFIEFVEQNRFGLIYTKL